MTFSIILFFQGTQKPYAMIIPAVLESLCKCVSMGTKSKGASCRTTFWNNLESLSNRRMKETTTSSTNLLQELKLHQVHSWFYLGSRSNGDAIGLGIVNKFLTFLTIGNHETGLKSVQTMINCKRQFLILAMVAMSLEKMIIISETSDLYEVACILRHKRLPDGNALK